MSTEDKKPVISGLLPPNKRLKLAAPASREELR